MSVKKTKIVLVGAGGWGHQHARIFHIHPDIEFAAVVGRNLEKTQQRADEYGVRAYTNITEAIEKEQPDLVSLSLPNEGHYDATLEVIQAGVPLLVEKPLVFKMDEADSLIDEAAKRDLFFAINFNHRYARPVQKTYDIIQSGRLGEIVHAIWRFGGEGGAGHPHANLIETQCHGFDMIEHLCGPIESVMAEMTDKTNGGFRTMVMALRFENKAIGSMVGSYDSSYSYPNTHRMEVNGTKGRALIEDTVRKFSFQEAGNETAEVWQAGYFNDWDREFHRTFDRHMDAILEAFRNGEQPPIHARAGRRALALAYATIESYETGKRVSV